VANYYIAKRGIPSANLCAITPPATTYLSSTAYNSTVKTPIQQCLNTLGPQNILYIVFAYQTPYKIIAPDNSGYALDQFVADIWDVYTPAGQFGIPGYAHPYYVEAQTQGNVYAPFLSLAAFRSQSGTLLYSVWRLDAASAALANGLVDKALLAESSGLSGQVCIDEQIAIPTYDYSTSGTPDWDLRQAAAFSQLAGFTVTQDFNSAEFGTSPAPLRCDNAALYSGGYSLNHYNDAFGWNAGAIGFHLDSASGYDPRGGTNWSANALQKGITATSGAVSEPFFSGQPHPDGVFRNLFEGANIGDAFMRNTMFLKWTMMNMGDPLYTPFPAGFPTVTAPQNSLGLTPRYLVGGNPSTGTITLAAPAPAGGVTVALQSNKTTAATVQPTVIIAGGQTTATFPISTSVVLSDSPLYITATFGTSTLTNTLVPQPLLAQVLLSPTSVIGGNAVRGTLFLNGPAPAGGITVTVSTTNSAVILPATVFVPQGAVTAVFGIGTKELPATATGTVSASYAGTTLSATLTVLPLAPLSVTLSPASVIGGVSTTANLVTMNAPAPDTDVVTLSSSDPHVTVPASVTVVAGNTASPVFTITTSLVTAPVVATISATFGGVTKTATLTVNPLVASPALSPTSVIGGTPTTLNKVTLNTPAPAGGIVVNLSSSDPGVTVPSSVTVAAGSIVSPYFTVTTSAVVSVSTVTISASFNGVTRTAILTVNPVALLSVTLSPTSLIGGVAATANKVTLNGPAPAGGIVVNLLSSDPSLTLPASVTVAAGATSSAVFTINTSAVAATLTVTISASYSGVTKTAILTVNPVALLSVTLSPTSLVGGVAATANKVTLNGPAPPAGVVVNLLSSDPSVTLPASVTVAAGATSSAVFTINTTAVAATLTVTISASYSGVTKTAILTVNPVALLSVTLSPTSLVGGVAATANKVTLNGPAPAGGTVVNLSSSDPSVTLPASVTVAAGATSSAVFTINTSAVAATLTVTISASYSGVTKTAILTVNPVALVSVTLSPTSLVGGVAATANKVTLNGPAPPAGVVVNLLSSDPSVTLPASVTVAAGATSSAVFTINTTAVAATLTVTISASYSGVTKTAILTVNPVALLSVTLSPTSLIGGVAAAANKVTLNGPAPPAGVVVNLLSSDPSVTLPASVTVAAGATSSAVFTINTSAVTATLTVTISASYSGVTKTAILTVNPVALLSLTLSPTSLSGGAAATANKVTLNSPAPPGGIVVNLSSSDPSVTLPASVTVAAGATSSAVFTINTSAVAATLTVTISASYNGVTKTAILTVNP